MDMLKIHAAELKQNIERLHCGDRILFSGPVYTARDAAHKKIRDLQQQGKSLPFEIKNSVIYYCGPTPSPPGLPIGSAGPTTSGRMDIFTPDLLDQGLCGMIGKGERSPEVRKAIIRNGAVYLCAVGGAGALAAKCIKSCEVIAFEELGCESIKKLLLEDFPLTVAIDCRGNSIFDR